jgi:hypothetical protein
VSRAIRIAASILAADFTRQGPNHRGRAGGGPLTLTSWTGGLCRTSQWDRWWWRRRRATVYRSTFTDDPEPEKHIQAFADAGANNLTVHVETCPHLPHSAADS